MMSFMLLHAVISICSLSVKLLCQETERNVTFSYFHLIH
jgi:hypothetical protein